MFIDDLSEHELGMLRVALKYWRANRQDTATRRTDPVFTGDTVNLLLAKLGGGLVSSLPYDRYPAVDLFPPLIQKQHKGHRGHEV